MWPSPPHHHTLTPHNSPPHGSLPHPLRTPATSAMAHVAGPPRSLHRPPDRCRSSPGCHVHTHAQQPLLIHHQTHHTTCTSYNTNNLHLTIHSCLQTYTSLPMTNTSLAPCYIRSHNTYHVPRTALHSTYQTLAPTAHPPTKKHLRTSPPTITASSHTAHRLMARSLTHYVLQLRQQWYMSQGNRDR
jgi:hypothetical protein